MTCAPSHLLPERNRVGRPRTVCPEPEELEALGIEMVEWFKVHPDALHISEWYAVEKFIVDKVWDVMIQKPEFLTYYELSMKLVGKKYLDKTSNVREGASQRWQRVYFKDLRKQEDEDLKAASNLKKEENKATSEADSAKLDTFINMVSVLQASSKDLKSATNNIISEEKS